MIRFRAQRRSRRMLASAATEAVLVLVAGLAHSVPATPVIGGTNKQHVQRNHRNIKMCRTR